MWVPLLVDGKQMVTPSTRYGSAFLFMVCQIRPPAYIPAGMSCNHEIGSCPRKP